MNVRRETAADPPGAYIHDTLWWTNIAMENHHF